MIIVISMKALTLKHYIDRNKQVERLSIISENTANIRSPNDLLSLSIHSESLRKYPPVTNLTRACTKDYQVDGTNFSIKKGQMVFIPAFAIQNDPDIYPNPSVFDPDRFTPEEQAKRSQYAYLPFGVGPRNVGLNLNY